MHWHSHTKHAQFVSGQLLARKTATGPTKIRMYEDSSDIEQVAVKRFSNNTANYIQGLLVFS